jgi:hypothetical protein
MRGKNGGLQEVVSAESLESRYFPRGNFLSKKQTVQCDLVMLPHLRDLGVLRDQCHDTT